MVRNKKKNRALGFLTGKGSINQRRTASIRPRRRLAGGEVAAANGATPSADLADEAGPGRISGLPRQGRGAEGGIGSEIFGGGGRRAERNAAAGASENETERQIGKDTRRRRLLVWLDLPAKPGNILGRLHGRCSSSPGRPTFSFFANMDSFVFWK
jgi:hypothetical protein